MAKILIVDDEPRIRELIREHLQHAGYECDEATDGSAALAKLKDLRSCDVHTTTLLGSVDEEVFRNLQMRVTSDPKYQRKSLYHKR